MKQMGHPYVGILYAGLMITQEGPKLIEYNARFGDPEAQVLMIRLKDDILTLMLATVDGTLDKVSVRWRTRWLSPWLWRLRVIPATSRRAARSRG